MNQSLKEITQDVADRFTSPFFGSFIVSWLAINWQIPASILLYTENSFYDRFCKSRMCFIESKLNWIYSFWFPLLGVVVYILLFKVVFKVVEGWMLKTGNNFFNKGAGDSTIVSIELLRNVNKEYDIKIKEYKPSLQRTAFKV